MKIVFGRVSRQQCVEFGQVAVLVVIVAVLYYRNFHFVTTALICMAITMILPRLWFPLAWIWFGLSKILGEINIRVLLTLIFMVVVLPVGLWHKLRGKDSLQLRQFKRGRESVMVKREHVYTKEDLLHTF
ncbi:hypothetical protein [Chitinophaga sp. MM2321]|uniref:hypothetical protein n=1 Tax=Chitinophaga sp. MM2321 TaxID=3137178 RepID=UPI0032D56791